MNNGLFDLKRKIAFAAALLVVSHSFGAMPNAVASPSAVSVRNNEKKVTVQENIIKNGVSENVATSVTTTAVTTSVPVSQTTTTNRISSSNTTTTTTSKVTSTSTVTTKPEFVSYTIKFNAGSMENDAFSNFVIKIFGKGVQIEYDEEGRYKETVKVPCSNSFKKDDILMDSDKVKYKLVSSKKNTLVYDVYYKVDLCGADKYFSLSEMPEGNYFKHGSTFDLSPSNYYLINAGTDTVKFEVNAPIIFSVSDINNDGFKLSNGSDSYNITARKFSINLSDDIKVVIKDGNSVRYVDNKNLKWCDINNLYITSQNKQAIIIAYDGYAKSFDISNKLFELNKICSVSKFAYVDGANFDASGIAFNIKVVSIFGDEYQEDKFREESYVGIQKGEANEEGDSFVICVPYLANNNYKLDKYKYKNKYYPINKQNADDNIDTTKYYKINVNNIDNNIEVVYKKIDSCNDYEFTSVNGISKRNDNCCTIDAYNDPVKLMSVRDSLKGSKVHYSYYNEKGLIEDVFQISKVEDWSLDRSEDKMGDTKFIFVRNILEKDGEAFKSHLDESVCFYQDKNPPEVKMDPNSLSDWSGKNGLNININVDDTEECPVKEDELFYEQNFIRDIYKKYINVSTKDKQEIKSLIVGDYRFDRPKGGWNSAKNMSGYVESKSVRAAEAKLVNLLRNMNIDAIDPEYCEEKQYTYDFYRDFIKSGGCEKVLKYYNGMIGRLTSDDTVNALKKEKSAFSSAVTNYYSAVEDDKLTERKTIPTLTFDENDIDYPFKLNIRAIDTDKESVVEDEIRIYAIDNSNNSDDSDEKSKLVKVKIDCNVPKIDDIKIEESKVYEIQKDGLKAFIINVGAVISACITDEESGVDPSKVILDIGSGKNLSMANGGDEYRYLISNEDILEDLKSILTISAEDKVGNKFTINTDGKFNVIVDNTKPDSSILNSFIPENCYYQVIENGENSEIRKWFKDYSDICFDITAADKKPIICSGISQINIFINDRSNGIKLEDNGIIEAELNKEGIYYVALEATDTPGHFNAFLRSHANPEFKVLACEDISCDSEDIIDENDMPVAKECVRIGFSVSDHAGNTSSINFETVYVDLSDPQIVSARANGTDLIGDGNFTYEVFSNSETNVRVRAEDSSPSSGIESVHADIYDENDNIVSENVIAEKDGQSDEWNVHIPVNFKGYLVLYAFDNVGRISEKIKTNGIITEDDTKHSETSEMTIVLPETEHRDIKGRLLYSDDVKIRLTVKDSFSGLAEIITSVTGMESLHTFIGEHGEIESNSGESWLKTEDGTDHNLITGLSREMILGRDSNDIWLSLDIKDHAGNPDVSSPESVNFSIDKTDPKIDVRYTDINGNPESGDKRLFNNQRRAVITITERNFDGDLAEVYVNGEKRNLSWTHSEGTDGTDGAKYQAEVEFREDGKYDLNVKCRDMGGRSAKEYDQKFEIDLTDPKLDVFFDRDVSNDHYYNDAVTATFRVEDANFDPAGINISGTFNQKSDGFPKASEWTRSGNDYVSTIRFDKNGEYEITVKGSDKAGNQLETYTEKLYVDTQKPVINIDEMNKSNNAGEIRPRIQFKDVNIDKDSIKIELEGANRGKALEYSGELIEKKDGYEYVFDNFPQTAEYDDIYTIKASAKDNADNKIEKEVSFSVNRFGSTFFLDEATAFVIGKYISEPRDIIITERNPDKHVDESNVFITIDAEMINLKNGVDYKVVESGGNGEWYEYQYIIFAKNFNKDAKYTVSIHAEDEAGNLNVSAALKNNASVSFSVDRTSPLCIPINISDNSSYKGESYTAKLSISDNISLKDVKVFVDGSPVATNIINDECTFEIYNSSRAQEISVVLTDMADNKVEYNYKNILVTTSVLRLLARKTWFKISCGATLLFAGASLIFFRRRRRLR